MQLLLLLSALLSALTGVVTGARAEAPPQVASMRVAAAVETVAQAGRVVSVRPVQSVASLVSVAAAPLVPAGLIVGTTKLYESRRRE